MNSAKRLAAALLALTALSLATSAAANDVREFDPTSMNSITARQCGKGPFALALWSLDCPHCKDGLAKLDKLRRQHPDLHVVLVQTDAAEQGETGAALLDRLGIQADERWVFGDDAPERLRYSVDRQWAGELPRTYLYREDCRRTGISGALKTDMLQAWLKGARP